ncbi:Tim9a [Carabus blaptoides fortunei]
MSHVGLVIYELLPPGSGLENVDPEQIKTFRDFLISYNKLSELCFIDCATDFTTRSVKPAEDKCALNCMEKFLKVNQRISQRFQEFQILANENALAAMQKAGQMPS